MSDTKTDLVHSFFTGTAASYDRVVHVFTLGLDYYWKRAMYRPIKKATRILDLACGTGILTMDLAGKFPSAKITGVDITPDYLQIYDARVKRLGINAQSVLGNAEDVRLEGQYDVALSSYIPKYVDPDHLLNNIKAHITPGGLIILHDFTFPKHPLSRGIWEVYNRIMNWLGLKLYPEWEEVFSEKLTVLIRQTRWFEEYPPALQRHGFELVTTKHLSFGSAGLLVARKN